MTGTVNVTYATATYLTIYDDKQIQEQAQTEILTFTWIGLDGYRTSDELMLLSTLFYDLKDLLSSPHISVCD